MQNDESFYKKSFGNRVRELRHEQSLSQENLADLCELDRTYIGGVERGERNISLINIVKIAHALKTTPSELMLPFSEKGAS